MCSVKRLADTGFEPESFYRVKVEALCREDWRVLCRIMFFTKVFYALHSTNCCTQRNIKR